MDLFKMIQEHQRLVEENSVSMSEEKNSPIEVTIKNGQFDTSKIVEYKGEKSKKFDFRPTKWDEFIGQTEAKNRAKTIIKKKERGLKSHFLVDGIKGHGKTTFVQLLAKDMDAHIIKRIGKQIDVDNLVNIINEINACEKDNIVFFVDEIDTMDKKVIKTLNPIIESFEIANKNIKHFIFAGATINKHILLENNPDTLDRIATHIKFARYNSQEISQIINQYIKQLYSEDNITSNIIEIISKNCKFNPRTAIGLLEEYVVEKNIENVLRNCHIVKDGLTVIDMNILKVLNQSARPMGANSLAMKVKLNQNEYIKEFEPYLIEYDYINRVPSRVISEKGKVVLDEICNS